jgi:hypothetical protein
LRAYISKPGFAYDAGKIVAITDNKNAFFSAGA